MTVDLNRHLIAARLRTLCESASALTGVTVIRTAVDAEAAETVLIGSETTGDLSIQHFKPVLAWADQWRVRVDIATRLSGRTLEEAESRCMALVNGVLGLIWDDPKLSSPTAITSFLGLDTTDSAEQFSLDGPHSGVLPDNSGFGSSASISIPFFSISGA